MKANKLGLDIVPIRAKFGAGLVPKPPVCFLNFAAGPFLRQGLQRSLSETRGDGVRTAEDDDEGDVVFQVDVDAHRRPPHRDLLEHVVDEIRARRSRSPKRFSRLQIGLLRCRRWADLVGLFGSMRQSFTNSEDQRRQELLNITVMSATIC